MWFSYTPFNYPHGPTYRPMVNVVLIFPSGEFPTKALVDSGADNSLFDVEMLEDRGVSRHGLPKTECTAAAGLKFDAWSYPVRAYVAHQEFKNIRLNLRSSFCFMREPSSNGPIQGLNLLGRNDFFAKFRIEFDNKGKRFRIERN